MYYELINEAWKANNAKSVFFNGSTYPIENAPVEFWNADRMQAATIPVYDSTTEKLVGPQVVGDKVGYVVEALTSEEIELAYQMTVPTVVSMRQARVYLSRAGLLDAVTAQISALGGEAEITWEYSQEVQRSNPLIATLGGALGWDELQLDQMFIDASQL